MKAYMIDRPEPALKVPHRLATLVALDMLRRAAELARRKRLAAAGYVWTVQEILEREG